MNNILLMLGALLVGILAALVAVPMIVDWNGYRGVFEEEASRLMGRDVRLGGGVNVRVLPVPYVRFEKLRIADTEATGGEPLFRAESVTMRLSIAPLLRGVLEAQSIELKRPQLRLAVDSEGRGNWRSLSLKPGSLPFVPADVTLQSVGIEGGTLTIAGPTGKELAQFGGIDGELSAEGFEGPYKFKGSASLYGELREFRLATTKAEADGSMRLRASVRLPANQNSYVFDGRLLDLKGKPHIDGELTAKLPIAAAAAPAGTAAPRATAEPDANAFELKAKAEGDVNGGQLTDIALSLDLPGDPQLITGQIKAAWSGDMRVDMALASRSFNLDRFAVGTAAADPLDTVRTGLLLILAALPAQAQTDAVMKADRVTIAGEAVTGVAFAVNRRGATLEVKDLKALLPGGTRLDAAGSIVRDAKSTGFNGPMAMRGTNLARFLSWAHKSSATSHPGLGTQAGHYEGPFALEGLLAMSATGVELTRGTAEIAGLPATGEVRYRSEGRRRLEVVIQGPRIDAAQLWPGGFDPEQLRVLLSGAVKQRAGAGEPVGFFGFTPESGDLMVDLRAAELQLTAATNLRDVDAAFSVDHGQLAVSRLRFATATGLGIELEGQLAGLAVPTPAGTPAAASISPAGRRGSLRWYVSAPNPAAVSELVEAIDWPSDSRPGPAAVASIASLGSMRLAGSTVLGERGATALDIALDGSIDGGRVTATAKLDGGLSGWRSHPAGLVASIDSTGVDRWLGLAGLEARTPGRPARPGQVFVKAEGTPESGVTALASLASDGLSVAYQGMAATGKSSSFTLDGVAAISGRDAAEALSLAGLTFGQGPARVPLSGHVQVKLEDGGRLALETSDMKIAQTSLRGSATIAAAQKSGASAQKGIGEVEAALSFDMLTLPGLLQVFADRRQDGSQSQGGTGRSVWPDQPVSFAGLDHLKGRLRVTAGRLGIDSGVALADVKADVMLGPGSIGIDDVMASGLGGSLRGQLSLHKVPAGAAIAGEWTLTGANLSGFGSATSAPFSLSASVKSEGLSPSGLVAALVGRGEAAFGAGKVKAVAPAAVAATVDAVLAGKVPPAGEELQSAMRQSLAQSTLDLPSRTLPLTVSQGIARIDSLAIATADGRATLDGSVDLNLMRFAADWRIEAAAKPGVTGKPKAPLPPVIVATSGPLSDLAESDTRLTISAFEQELAVRKLERDVEELERLRKIDEERRQKEDDDRKAAEAAAPAAAVSGSAGPSPASGAPETATPAWAPPGIEPAPSAAVPIVAPPPAAPAAQPVPPGRASGLTRDPDLGTTARRRAQESFPKPLQNNF